MAGLRGWDIRFIRAGGKIGRSRRQFLVIWHDSRAGGNCLRSGRGREPCPGGRVAACPVPTRSVMDPAGDAIRSGAIFRSGQMCRKFDTVAGASGSFPARQQTLAVR